MQNLSNQPWVLKRNTRWLQNVKLVLLLQGLNKVTLYDQSKTFSIKKKIYIKLQLKNCLERNIILIYVRIYNFLAWSEIFSAISSWRWCRIMFRAKIWRHVIIYDGRGGKSLFNGTRLKISLLIFVKTRPKVSSYGAWSSLKSRSIRILVYETVHLLS